jgi:hypothetical protein
MGSGYFGFSTKKQYFVGKLVHKLNTCEVLCMGSCMLAATRESTALKYRSPFHSIVLKYCSPFHSTVLKYRSPFLHLTVLCLSTGLLS